MVHRLARRVQHGALLSWRQAAQERKVRRTSIARFIQVGGLVVLLGCCIGGLWVSCPVAQERQVRPLHHSGSDMGGLWGLQGVL